jgi:hypothetical protein
MHHSPRSRIGKSLCVALGVAAATLSVRATPASALGLDAGLAHTSGGTVAVTCQTPTPVGVEASPTVSSQGVTVPTMVTPPLAVPAVTIGPVQAGPAIVGPLTAGGFTVPSQTLGGGTYGRTSQADQVAGVGATSCIAVNVDNPSSIPTFFGTIRLEVHLEELNLATNTVAFVKWSEVDSGMRPQDLLSGCACPPPRPLATRLATGAVIDFETAVPGAGQVDPRTGNVSLGLAQIYVGVQVVVNAVAQPTGVSCEGGDFGCSNSGVFPVY